MKIYTKTGDKGDTGLFGGPRVPKDHLRVEAYGTVDELNAVLGMVRSQQPPEPIDELLTRIQNELFAIGAQLATPDPAAQGTQFVRDEHVTSLETAIDQYQQQLSPLRQFILPAGTPAAAGLHFARGVCRRAERRLVRWMHQEQVHASDLILQYLNRLGDLLFVLARAANAAAGLDDVPWKKDST